MSATELPPPFALFRLVTGYYVSQALHAVALLGVADLIAETPRSASELGEATGTHAPSLGRVLRLLVSSGVLTEDEHRRFGLTAMGHCLRADVPGSMRATTLLFGGTTQRAWSDLLRSIETGEPAFPRVFGKEPFEYLADHPDEAANFDAAMASFSQPIGEAVAAAYDFSRARRIVDVGGGNGSLLAYVLGHHAGPTGVVFDLPSVAARARAHLAHLGVADRCEVVGGDFFESVPGGADIYLLKHVIHDWNDERAVEILTTVRRAMPPAAKVLIVEGVYPARVDTSDESRGAASNDVNMLVCTGGRQRTEEEFRALYGRAGLELSRIIPTSFAVSLIEGVAA